MHILEKYATDSGVKINKPFIYEKFYPLTFNEKYIILCTRSNNNINEYKYWNDVIEIIYPYLNQNNIKILHFSFGDDVLNNCININSQISLNQKAYLLKRCILYIGQDDVEAQIASHFNKKTIILYSNYFEQNTKPYWSNKKNYIGLFPQSKNKPSFDKDDKFDLINKIYPEEISKNLLNLLNIKYGVMPKTIFIGEDYTNKTLEIIPDGMIDPNKINVDKLIVRMDYVFNETVLEFFLKYKKCIIFTNKIINFDIINLFKNNIINIIYDLEENEDVNFIKNLKNIGVKYTLISNLDDDRISKLKLKYMDYGIIHKKNPTEIPEDIKKNKNDLYFKSGRILISSDGVYYSKYHWQNKIKQSLLVNKNDVFFEDIDKIYIYSIDNEN